MNQDPYIQAFERYSKRHPFKQFLIDIGAILFGAAAVVVTALGIPLAAFLLFFCEFR